jgi:hypothetical protein
MPQSEDELLIRNEGCDTAMLRCGICVSKVAFRRAGPIQRDPRDSVRVHVTTREIATKSTPARRFRCRGRRPFGTPTFAVGLVQSQKLARRSKSAKVVLGPDS